MSVRYLLYDVCRSVLPKKVQLIIGKNNLLRPLRDFFLRNGGVPRLESGEISFERYLFSFSSPFSVLRHARSGIESKICRLIMAEAGERGICVDVGANYGFITLIMGLTVKPLGKVLTFEAESSIYNDLKGNIARNGLDDICVPLNARIGAGENDRLDKFVCDYDLEDVSIIKIDTDGVDFEVLKGAKQTLNRFHPLVIVEMTENRDDIYKFLQGVGYKFLLDMEGDEVRPPNYPPNLIASTKKILIPKRGAFAC